MKIVNNFLKIRKTKSICWLTDDIILFCKKGVFYSYNLPQKQLDKIAKIPTNFKESIFSLFYLGRRLFRLYPQSPALNKNTNELFFSFCGYIYCLDLNTNVLKKEVKLNHNASRVLSICVCPNNDVYYGEYPIKYDNQPVCIFKRNNEKEWAVAYKFEPNTIRHIHLLKEYNNNLYCFTGDENNQVNILCFENKNFNDKPIIIAHGNQKYRTCVATFSENKLYYLTDNPYFENKLCCFNLERKSLDEMFSVEGSVIYGVESNGKLYFSTCVEKNLAKNKDGNNVALKIDGVNGGIRSKTAFAYCFDINKNELKKIYSLKKDMLSIKYFGLGTFTFACNFSNKYFALTSSSLQQHEKTFVLNLESEEE